MKKTPIVALVALACAGLSPAFGGKAGEAGGIPMRPTSEQLAKRMAERPDVFARHRGLDPVEAEAIRKRQSGERLGGLLSRSVMLTYGDFWTLVPKGAVLHVPEAYRSRLVDRPAGTLLPWKEFHARNRGWIFTQPVTIETARGEKALSEAVCENHRRLGRVVVAVLHTGPISVKPAAPAPFAPDSEAGSGQPRISKAP